MNESDPLPEFTPRSPVQFPDEDGLAKTVPSSAGPRFETGGVSAPVPTAMPREDLAEDMLIRGVPRIPINGRDTPVLGGVALLAKLGQGGMGKVYFGFHLRLEKEVAVKIVWADMAERVPELIPRFKREAKLAAKVHSPHLVSVLDVDAASGLHYMVMEYVHGLPIAKHLRRVKQSGRPGLLEIEALEICIASTKGLAAAHEKNIIHRDVKPDNILVPSDEVTGEMYFAASKLADLGIARQEASGDSQLTGSLQFMGTPGFAAPEQAADAASCGKPADIFSMGATLYTLLAGKEPFSLGTNSNGERMSHVVLAVRNTPHAPIQVYRPDVSPATAALIDRCLQKTPDMRFQDAKDLLLALQKSLALLNTGIVSPPVDDNQKSAPVFIDRGGVSNSANQRDATDTQNRTAPWAPQTLPIHADRQGEKKRRENQSKKPKLWLVPVAGAALVLIGGALFAAYSARGFLLGRLQKQPEKIDATNPATSAAATTVKATTPEVTPTFPDKPVVPDKNPAVIKQPDNPKPADIVKQPDIVKPADIVKQTEITKPNTPENPKVQEKNATNALELDLGNNRKIEFVQIPAGSFQMGSPASESARDEFEIQHEVKISKAFMMGKTEITQEQYEAVMGENPSEFKGAALPVENVSWINASAFCEKLRATTGRNVQLPSEAQWEYACRGGTSTPFNTGETIAVDQANYDGEAKYGSGVPGENRRKTTPVGTFKPNAFGLYDMHGNVLEWCLDWYDENYYRTSATADPLGPSTGGTRVVRGGSWSMAPRIARSANRFSEPPIYKHSNLGFRIVVLPE